MWQSDQCPSRSPLWSGKWPNTSGLSLYTHETALLSSFIEKLRFAYSVDDFIDAVKTVLEDQGDCSVLYVDSTSNYVMYHSPDRIVSAELPVSSLESNFLESWLDGVDFVGVSFGVL